MGFMCWGSGEECEMLEVWRLGSGVVEGGKDVGGEEMGFRC